MLARLFFRAKGVQNGFAHGGFRSVLAGPEFPLCYALRNKHFYARDGGDSFTGGELQELRLFRAIDEVHDDAAI